jgi:hypothetical protein
MIEEKTYCDTSKLSIRLITKSVAKDIIVNNHYSGLWTKVSYAIGLFTSDVEEHPFFDNVEDTLIGVACYGDPIGRSAGQSITPLLERDEVLELTRLFVFDDYGSNIESWFLGQTFDWLRINVPKIKGLISYSDPKEGHCGTIYQATNWLYQGNKLRFNDSWDFRWEENGDWHHQRTSYVKFGTNNPKEIQKISASTFWIRKNPRKHRYVYILAKGGVRRKLMKTIKHPTFPYPKENEQFVEEIIKMLPINLVESN